MLDDRELSELVGRIVRRRFSDAVINVVDVKTDVDSDGDAVLRVTVVFETNAETLDPDEMVGLVRHIRPELARVGIESFPLVRFIAKADAVKLKLESV